MRLNHIPSYLVGLVLACTLWACGKSPAPLPIQSGLTHGSSHSLKLSPEGELFSVGANHRGQLGYGSDELITTKFQPVNDIPKIAVAAAGNAHSVVLSTGGQVFVFGDNRYGQLGSRQLSYASKPQKVDLPEAVVSVASGGAHILALSTSGRVYQWGSNESNQLFLTEDRKLVRPLQAAFNETVVAIGASTTYSAVLLQGGSVIIRGADFQSEQCCWPNATSLTFDSFGLNLRSRNSLVHMLPIPAFAPIKSLNRRVAH